MVYDKVYTTRTKKPSLKALVLLSEESPQDLPKLIALTKRLKKTMHANVEELKDDLFLVRIQKEVWDKRVSGHIIIDHATRGCWIAYTDEGGYFVKRVLEPLFDGLYPNVARVYFNFVQIRKFLEHIEDAYQGSKVVTHVAYKRQLRRAKAQPKGTRLLWEPGAEEELRRDTAEYRIWIDNLTFEVKDAHEMILLEASLTGRGLARLKFGTFSDFSHNVIQLYIGLATRWKNFFSHRERLIEDGKVKLSPYQLQYPFTLSKPQIEELIANLRSSYSYSILFGGNPYFAANLTDYKEGSSFYLTVLHGNVTITPMLKSTPYALWRIASKVQRVAGEGEIVNVPKGPEP